MTSHVISPKLLKSIEYQTPISEFYAKATYMSRRQEPGSIDFTLGDGHEMPPAGLVEALQRWIVPQNESWFAYTGNLMESRITVSAALSDLEQITLDLDYLQRKRDWMVKSLQEMGYRLQIPDGTFFLLVQSPWKDDCAFAELLASHDIFVLPGTPQEIPGYFRISLTASEDAIARALPKFKAAMVDAYMTN